MELPVGAVLPYLSFNLPNGYLLCDGNKFDKDKYPFLFDVLKTDILPDLREVALFGCGRNQNFNFKCHDVFNLFETKDDCLQEHEHYATFGTNNSDENNETFAITYNLAGPNIDTYENIITEQITNSEKTPPVRTGNVTRCKGYGVNYIIKAEKTNKIPQIELETYIKQKVEEEIKKKIQVHQFTKYYQSDFDEKILIDNLNGKIFYNKFSTDKKEIYLQNISSKKLKVITFNAGLSQGNLIEEFYLNPEVQVILYINIGQDPYKEYEFVIQAFEVL